MLRLRLMLSQQFSSLTNSSVETITSLHELSYLMGHIETRQNEMKIFAESSNEVEEYTLKKFAEWVVSYDTMAVRGILSRIHMLVIGSGDSRSFGNAGAFALLADRFEVNILLTNVSGLLFQE